MTTDYTPNTCSVRSCPFPRAKSWRDSRHDLCATHYKRARLYGSPTVEWLRTTELTPYRILVKKYRPTTKRGYVRHPPQDVLDALSTWLDPEGEAPKHTATTQGARSPKERAAFKRMLSWWWNAPGKTRSQLAVANTQRKVLTRVYWRLVAVACAVEEMPARFSKSSHYAYVLAVLKMRKGWRNHYGGPRRLLALRWSELGPRLAFPIAEEARRVLARKREVERLAEEQRQREAEARRVARIGRRQLIRLIITTRKVNADGWGRVVSRAEVLLDAETNKPVTDATPEERQAARVEQRFHDQHPKPRPDHQAMAHQQLARYRANG